jgi:alpha-soluble NSF attachment protein
MTVDVVTSCLENTESLCGPNQDVSFSDTRECTLLKELLDAVDEGDVEKFTNAVFEFDQISKLDKWKTTILLRIKTHLNDMEGDMC